MGFRIQRRDYEETSRHKMLDEQTAYINAAVQSQRVMQLKLMGLYEVRIPLREKPQVARQK
jgi:hypothetical protein